MTDIWWNINGRQISLDDIRQEKSVDQSPFAHTIMRFGQSWLRGDETFALTTSGSTGIPKSVTLHRHAMEASARMTEKALGLQEGDTALLCLDPRYIAGTMMLVRSLTTGMNLVAVEPAAMPLQQVSPDIQIDFAALVPYQMQALLSDPSALQRLHGIRNIILGGAPISEIQKKHLQGLKGHVYATYGMTETLSHIALQRLNGSEPQDFFTTLPGIEIELDNRSCLTIGASWLGIEKVITNDLVELLTPKQFRWLGRIDRVINSGGVKIIPEKVEKEVRQVFQQLSLANRFFVASLPDAMLGNKVVLVIEGNLLSDALRAQIHAELTLRLDRYEVPRSILVSSQFAETGSQKIDQQATLNEL